MQAVSRETAFFIWEILGLLAYACRVCQFRIVNGKSS